MESPAEESSSSQLISIGQGESGSVQKEVEPPLIDEKKKKILASKRGVDFFTTLENFVNQTFETHKDIKQML